MPKVNLSNIQHVYFIGIGGIGMSALARYFLHNGIQVSGYDKVETLLTQHLISEGANIHYKVDLTRFSSEEVEAKTIIYKGLENKELRNEETNNEITNNEETNNEELDSKESTSKALRSKESGKESNFLHNLDLVIYTPAIPKDHKELSWFQKSKIPVLKRSVVLGLLSKKKRCVAVAGTHGKTSTSALIGHILKDCDHSPTVFVGGIMKNYNSNLILGDSNWVIVEADEYDRSFLQLSPEILILMSLDPDHLDIYGDFEQMVAAYEELCLQIKERGKLVVHNSVMRKLSKSLIKKLTKNKIQIFIIGLAQDVEYSNINIRDHHFYFDYRIGNLTIDDILSVMPGNHNVINATGAITAAHLVGVNGLQIKLALSQFKGIKRRFETVYESNSFVLIDDYAHHPEELKAAIGTARLLYPNRRISAIFQPHLYTRTRDFYQEFATVLDGLDELYLLPVYPAREEPIPGVNSQMILNIMKNNNGYIVELQQLIHKLHENKPDVLMTLGASDIDRFHGDIMDAVLK